MPNVLLMIVTILVSLANQSFFVFADENHKGLSDEVQPWLIMDLTDFEDTDHAFESLAPIVEANQIELITNLLDGGHKEVSTGSDAVRRLSDTKIEVFSRYAVASELRPLAEDLFVRFANDRLETFRLDRQSDAGYYIPMLVMRLNRQLDSDSNAVLYERV